jgi:thiopurine S-methyltransferase
MEPGFWQARWAERKIGFHEGVPNGLLAAHATPLDGARRVLVPLCGKSEDLAFLAGRGHAVVGVELVEEAAREFFAEHALDPAVARRGDHAVYTAGAITIITGDWFAPIGKLVGSVDAFYDRAALIAMPPERRDAYVAQLRSLCRGPGLVITIEYAAGALAGPPFAVDETEVLARFPSATRLAEAPVRTGRIAELGIAAVERCYHVASQRRPTTAP